ncbi:FixH family protein [Castellaniella sp.]|uniref:FixH family protein n=1 Tax=Castellaniella sp. TaxID=1955812 RepID=UPI0035649173
MALLLASALPFMAAPALAGGSLAAQLACVPAQARLAYDCLIHVTDQPSGDPVDGLAIQAKADMPSMPLAHNIPPVRAQSTGEPGVYQFSITLDMYGRWAFSMTIMGARQDMLVEVLDFVAPDGEDDAHGHHHDQDHDDHSHGHDAHASH